MITEVNHSASNNYHVAINTSSHYENRLTAIRKIIPWRAARDHNSVETKIHGIQTATVVGPPGEEIHTDEYGRVRVQFHWDRVGSNDDKSSAWIRVATPWAGANFGMTSIPRIGTEVLVQFLDGNPDRPIITGMVPNADTMPPWTLPANKTQSGVLTRSTPKGAYSNANALRFEDKNREEQLWLHAEKDQLTEVEHDEDKWVGNDRRKTIDRDETTLVKRDRTETVDHDEKISIGDNRTEDVGKNETIDIGGKMTKDGNCEGYSKGSAPTVCVEGVNNGNGSHKMIHKNFDKGIQRHVDGFFGNKDSISYTKARDLGLESIQSTFAESKCDTTLRAQLDAYYSKKCKKSLPPVSGTNKRRTDPDAGNAN